MSATNVIARSALVTGANRGIGLELCNQLCSSSYSYSTVFAVCRKTSPDLTTLAKHHSTKVKVIEGIDVTSDEAPGILEKILTDEYGSPGIHLLVHNAGAYGPPTNFDSPSDMYQSQNLDNITPERMRFTLELNTIGVLFITKALLRNLRKAVAETQTPSKITIISSAMGSIADNTSGKHYAYRTAKAAVNMVGKSLSEDLKEDKISVGLVHPGYIFSGFGGEKETTPRPGQRSVEEGAKGIIDAIDSLTMETTGSFIHGNYGEGIKPMMW